MKLLLLITILTSFCFPLTFPDQCWAKEKGKKNAVEFLPEILSMPDYQTGSGIFFSDQNTGRNDVIQGVFSDRDFKTKIIIDPESGKSVHVYQTIGSMQTPNIEFRKINPTKYRIRIHKAKNAFPLIFSESFHDGWKAYIARRQRPEDGRQRSEVRSQGAEESGQKTEVRRQQTDIRNEEMIGLYKILEGNEEDQASLEELKEFLTKGLVTDLGDGRKKERKHKRYLENGREELDHIEKYAIDFISKSFHGTIQNDNLPGGSFWESWIPGRFLSNCNETKEDQNNKPCEADAGSWDAQNGVNDDIIQWPDVFHWQVNGYANSWWIIPDMVRRLASVGDTSRGFYTTNSDGSIDFEIILEFWPQRLFYIGLFISGMTLLGCIIYLAYDWLYRRKVIIQREYTV